MSYIICLNKSPLIGAFFVTRTVYFEFSEIAFLLSEWYIKLKIDIIYFIY